MAAYFGCGGRSRTVLRDEDILNILQDGNESDIDELNDDVFDPNIFGDILDNQSQDSLEELNNDPSSSYSIFQQPPASQQSSSSSQTTPTVPRPEAIVSSGRSGIWRQVPFCDKSHEYSQPPSGPVQLPQHYFENYFNHDFFEMASTCTNQYYMRKTGQELKTNAQEIASLLGIHLIMGVIPYPRLPMYWKLNVRLPLIADSMSRDRFLQLRNALHVVDTDTPPPLKENELPNPLWKVQPVIDCILRACYKLERVPGFYSIDEQMIPFTGRCPVRQVVKNKPRPVGLKNFVATTSEGLMVDFEIYRGAKTMFGNTNLGLGPSVVLHLAKTIPPGSCIYHDRFFTTVPLIEELERNNLHGTGTIMLNRIPGRTSIKFMKDKDMTRGESQLFCRDPVALVKWKDNKSVLLVSNCTGNEHVEIVKRWDKQTRSYIDVTAPKIVTNYNSYMGGVDILDQMMEYYRTFIKTNKWTLKVIIHFLDLAVVNSWRQYKIDCEAANLPKKKIMDLLDFKMALADSLLLTPINRRRHNDAENDEDLAEDQPPVKRKYMPSKPSEAKRYDGYDHLPMFDDIRAPRTCRMENCVSRSKIRCVKCDVYLCLSRGKDCFKNYHLKN
ncbi:piggyBac transposable element-derived protein 3-like [Plodia interpunctella]|uniref:piggyBac transposable element-derived protein 3-like n=1 Tax=Plodia interpunctella TaxID=58824 RepID=UPI0023684D64|nr:piggyBac transposable element-derived protein 3-like [Plodia interpunctella]XP_053603625.1 piggyBac transposable element-derived protein 3-like [Plodia interpunctella]XP_053611132.1 piggyBac transposable element-derived protein 3-like [Plodia interpunctella]